MTISDKIISQRVRKLREVRNIAAKELAEKLNMNPRIYGFYEEGKSKLNGELIFKIATILDIKVDYFFTTDEKAEDIINTEISNQLTISCKKEVLPKVVSVITILNRIDETKLTDKLENALLIIINNLTKKTD